MGLRIIASARKHGISDDDIIYTVEHALRVLAIGDETQKLLYIGFDRHLRLLEIITVSIADNDEVVIHAMKATRKVVRVLKELTNDNFDDETS